LLGDSGVTQVFNLTKIAESPDIRLDILGSAFREEMDTIPKEVSKKLNQYPLPRLL